MFVGIFAELDQSAAGAFGMEEGDVETFGSFSGRFIDQATAFALIPFP